MRWLLVIPACILFLSNMPFFMEMKMSDVAALPETASGTGCCASKKEQPMTCRKSVMLCPVQPEGSQNSCTRTSDTSCICISCFQFTAAAPASLPFKMTALELPVNYTGFLVTKWINLPPPPPWQPPDIA